MEAFTYLLVDLACISIPLAFSFENRVAFYKRWKIFALAAVVVAIPFIAWDIGFTRSDIWGFNPEYLVGVDLLHLPIEEWLFFLCIPFACLFTFEFVTYFRRRKEHSFPIILTFSVAVVFLALTAVSWGKLYSFLSFGVASAFMIFCLVSRPRWMTNFFIMFALILTPFILSNGVLTGLRFWEYPPINTSQSIADMIVWYNAEETWRIRIFSIPVEDLGYAFSMLGWQVTIFEWLKRRSVSSRPA